MITVLLALAALFPRVDDCLQRAKVDAAGAAECLADLQARDDVSDDEKAEAKEAAAVVARLLPHLSAPAPVAQPVATDEQVKAFVTDGHLEAVVSGAAFGGVAGFVGTAGVLAATRTSERDATPLLLTAPVIGVVAGGLAAWGAVEASGANADDVAFVSATSWAGMVMGLTLQLAVFADSRDVQSASLRFFTTLSGGALGLAAGVGWAPYLDISAGDVSLANSGLLWGAVLTTIGLGTVQPQGLDLASGTMIVGGGGLLPFIALLALHPLLDLHRVSTWAIDVCGAVGFFGGVVVGFIAATVANNGRVFGAVLGGSVVAGLGVGAGVAVAVDGAARSAFDDAPPPLSVRPHFLPAIDGVAPGVLVEVRAW